MTDGKNESSETLHYTLFFKSGKLLYWTAILCNIFQCSQIISLQKKLTNNFYRKLHPPMWKQVLIPTVSKHLRPGIIHYSEKYMAIQVLRKFNIKTEIVSSNTHHCQTGSKQITSRSLFDRFFLKKNGWKTVFFQQ